MILLKNNKTALTDLSPNRMDSDFDFSEALNVDFRTWTNAKGTPIMAKFVSLEGNKVTILKQDDLKNYTIGLDTLSSADQDYTKASNNL